MGNFSQNNTKIGGYLHENLENCKLRKERQGKANGKKYNLNLD